MKETLYLIEKEEVPAIVQELLKRRQAALKPYLYCLSHHDIEGAKSYRYRIRRINEQIAMFRKMSPQE